MELPIILLLLTISVSNCLPQYYEPTSHWRPYSPYPRSIPSPDYYPGPPVPVDHPTWRQSYTTTSDLHVRMAPKSGGPVSEHFGDPIYKNYEVQQASSQVTTRILNRPNPVPNSDKMYSDQNLDFVFPGYVNTRRTPNYRPSRRPIRPASKVFIPDPELISKNCGKGATFCNTIDNYPSEYIKKYFRETSENFDEYFGTDEIVSVNISTRIGVGDGDGTPMCEAYERVIQPSLAKNKDDEWKYIVNDDVHVQGIRVEMCNTAGSACAMSDNFPLSYTTECKQKFIYRKLLALDKSGVVESDNFRLPSCCVCVYRPSRLARSVFELPPK